MEIEPFTIHKGSNMFIRGQISNARENIEICRSKFGSIVLLIIEIFKCDLFPSSDNV